MTILSRDKPARTGQKKEYLPIDKNTRYAIMVDRGSLACFQLELSSETKEKEMKLLAEMFKLLGEFAVITAITTVLLVIVIVTPPVPIVSVKYRGQAEDEIVAEDVSAVLIWDKAQGRLVPVEEPQQWFAEYEGRYEISYDAPDSTLWNGD